jgi:hypothetical protein
MCVSAPPRARAVCCVKYTLAGLVVAFQLINTFLSAQLQTHYKFAKPFFLVFWYVRFCTVSAEDRLIHMFV